MVQCCTAEANDSLDSLNAEKEMQVGRRNGFTLIELLVVIAVIAILIGVLLPALSKARDTARVVKCGSNARQVAIAVVQYASQFGYYPLSYVYGSDETSLNWRTADQQITNPTPENGYVHWSWALFSQGAVNEDAFKCPTLQTGGAPRSNPGSKGVDWEDEQENDLGGTKASPSSPPEDRQVRRMAYTGNAALFPRNKLDLAGTRRKNELVRDANVTFPSNTIALTEFYYNNNWSSIRNPGDDSGGGKVIKSHRSVTPFVGYSTNDVYNQPFGSGTNPAFGYPDPKTRITKIAKAGEEIPAALGTGSTSLNAVGRHHPGKDANGGGSANFAFADTHVEQTTLTETIVKRRWGERFFSISGPNAVDQKNFVR
jgi:prepilin-type N-terminal cleavage/methylation domain-containing protein/prepilin-type processing-associated H-X9-DG protein